MKHIPKAIIFDIGNTLLDASGISNHALTYTAKALQEKDIIVSATQFCNLYSKVDSQLQGYNINHLYSGVSILEAVAKKMKLKNEHQFFYWFLFIYRNQIRSSIKQHRDVKGAFAKLKKRNIKIGILTDGTTYEQLDQLYLLGVIDSIEAVVTSEELKVEKPSSTGFLTVLDKLNCVAKDAVMVGDDIFRDIIAAKQVGMTTVLTTEFKRPLVSKKHAKSVDYVIGSIVELPNLFVK